MSTGLDRAIKDILQAIAESAKKKTSAYDTQATVKRVDGNTAWVHIPGGVDETPVKLTVDAKEGDIVQVRVGGGKAWITGNQTAPPTDDTQANAAKKHANLAYGLAGKAISTAEEVASNLDELASEVADISEIDDVTVQYCLSNSNSTFQQYGNWSNTPPAYVAGKYYWTRSVIEDDEGNVTYGEPRYSQDTQLSVETDVAFKSNNNHFWHDSSGVYVTTADKSYANGSAVRITSSGILQQVNGSTVSSWTNSGISFLQGGSPVASFGSGGVDLYSSGTRTLGITSDAVSFYDTYGANVGNIFLEKVTSTYKSMSFSVVNKTSDPLYYAGLSVRTSGTNNHALVALTAQTSNASSSSLNITESEFVANAESAYHFFKLNNGAFTSSEPYYVGSYKLLTTGTVTDSFPVNAKNYSSDTVGYKAIGVVGWSYTGNTSTYCNMYVCYMDDDEKIHYGFRNLHESNNASLSLVFYVLYVASSQGV